VHQYGLTELYNNFHDPDEQNYDFLRLRELHTEIDQVVARAYGWNDFDFGHDFHEVTYLPENDRVRFTVSEQARLRILDHLSRLNRERYEQDVAQDLPRRVSSTRSRASRGSNDAQPTGRVVPFPIPVQPPLFPVSRQVELWEVAEPGTDPTKERMYISDTSDLSDETLSDSNGLSIAAQALLAWFRQQADWRSRSDVLKNTGFTPSGWPQAVQELLEAGLVERTGEKRGTRYRAKI
jgi:hypothetical protein